MAFWNSETLKHRLPAERLIHPYDPNRVQHAAYELSVGPETFLTSDPAGTKQQLDLKGQIAIPPGQLGLLLTDEEVRVPLNAIGLISIKAGIKFRGLVNVSGFHVDPGFHGRLKFSVYNAGSRDIVLSRNQAAFLIWFSSLDEETKDPYDGDHMDQMEISAEDVMKVQGEVASPGQLRKEIQELRSSVSNIKTALGILGTLIVGLILGALRFLPLSSTSTPVPQSPALTQSVPSTLAKTSGPPTPGKGEETKAPSSPPDKRLKSK